MTGATSVIQPALYRTSRVHKGKLELSNRIPPFCKLIPTNACHCHGSGQSPVKGISGGGISICIEHTKRHLMFLKLKIWECSIIHYKDCSVLTLHCLPKVVQVCYLKHKLIMRVHPTEWGLQGSAAERQGKKKTFMYRNFKWEVELGLWVLNITNSSIPWSSCISQKPHQILSVRHGFLHLPNNCEAGGESRVQRQSGAVWKMAGIREKKSESTENIKVLMFLTESPATSVRDSLERIILFRASMSAVVAVVVFVFVCLSSRAHPNIWGGSGGGGVGSGRGNIKSRFRSLSANRSECLPWHIFFEVGLRAALFGLEIFKDRTSFAAILQCTFSAK